MPTIKNTQSGEWKIGACNLKTGNKLISLSDSLLEVNLFQSIYDPFEKAIFIIANDAAVDAFLPIVLGTQMFFKYKLNGLTFSRTFKLTSMSYITEEDKSKGLKLSGISEEFYDADMNKTSISYKNVSCESMLKKNGLTDFFHIDKTKTNTVIIPNGQNRLSFISKIINDSDSLSSTSKARLLKTKEGYSIGNFSSFDEAFKKHYNLNPSKAIELFYKTNELKKDIGHSQAGDKIPIKKMTAIDMYLHKTSMSLGDVKKHKEGSYLIDEFDPMNKKYTIHRYDQRNNTDKSSTLYLEEDIEQVQNRYFVLNSKSNELYDNEFNEFSLNKTGFSAQNVLSVEMNSSVLCELGVSYYLEVGADLPGEFKEYKDPIISGHKICIEARHIFKPEELAQVIMTLAGDGGIKNESYLKESKLGKT